MRRVGVAWLIAHPSSKVRAQVWRPADPKYVVGVDRARFFDFPKVSDRKFLHLDTLANFERFAKP